MAVAQLCPAQNNKLSLSLCMCLETVFEDMKCVFSITEWPYKEVPFLQDMVKTQVFIFSFVVIILVMSLTSQALKILLSQF